MFWNKKKEILPKKLQSNLGLTMMDGIKITWSRDIDKPSKDKMYPWADFYTWFFCKTGEYYVVRYDKGLTVIKRKDIVRFNIFEEFI